MTWKVGGSNPSSPTISLLYGRIAQREQRRKLEDEGVESFSFHHFAEREENMAEIAKRKEKKKYIRYTLTTVIDISAKHPEEMAELTEVIEKNQEIGSCEIIDTVIIFKEDE